jgi:hypothetical protein
MPVELQLANLHLVDMQLTGQHRMAGSSRGLASLKRTFSPPLYVLAVNKRMLQYYAGYGDLQAHVFRENIRDPLIARHCVPGRSTSRWLGFFVSTAKCTVCCGPLGRRGLPAGKT